MKSKWFEYKDSAVQMRKRGASIRTIEQRLGIPRSTLSGWLKDVPLAPIHQRRLKKRWNNALIEARKRAVLWHNAQKLNRIQAAREAAHVMLSSVDAADSALIELALAFLYLGEGNKRTPATALGNSDPAILRFFIVALRTLYDVPLSDIRCELHLRADHDPSASVSYWSAALGLPEKNFGKPSVDPRTAGKPSYERYKGVCVIRCSRVAIQRKLMYIAEGFCEAVTVRKKVRAVSSVGRASA